MEQQQNRDSSNPSCGRCPFFLGYFLQPHSSYYDDDDKVFDIEDDGSMHPADPDPMDPKPVIQFVYSSKEAKDLQEGIWGANMDASLTILDQNKAQIVGSSNGFLLCCTNFYENMEYTICNPVTREFKLLPKPHKVHAHVALALICRGDDPLLDGMDYEVVRIGVSDPRRGMGTTLEIETFSSSTGEWKETSLSTVPPFAFTMHCLITCVLQDVIFWKDAECKLVAYDPARACVEIMDMPEENQNAVSLSYHLGISEGKIMYARRARRYLEVWALEDYKRSKWILKTRVSSSRICQENPFATKAFVQTELVSVAGFHPRDSQLVLLTLNDHPYWFDLGSCKLNKLGGYQHYHQHYHLLCDHFKYEWPCNPYGGAADQ